MTDTDPGQPLSSRLQVTMTTLAGAVSVYALARTLDGRPVGAYALVILMLVSLLPGVRRTYSRKARWVARVVLAGLVLAFSPVASLPAAFAPLNPGYVHRLGLLVAVELVVRSFGAGATLRQFAVRLALSGTVLCSAAVTFEAFPVRYFVPAWMACACLALAATGGAGAKRWRTPQVAAVIACLILGYLFNWGVQKYGLRFYQDFDRATRRDNDARGAGGARSVTGGNTSGQLRAVFNLGRSEVVALRITGTPGPLHLRGLTFDTYGTRGLWEPMFERARLRPLTTQPTLVPSPAPPTGIRIERVNGETGLLYFPSRTKRLTLINSGPALVADASGPAVVVPIYDADDSQVTSATYDVDSASDASKSFSIPLSETLSREALARCRALPADLDPRARALAQQIVGNETDPARVAALVGNYLRQHYTYALEGDLRSAANDPLAAFLFDAKEAHCQYFASAAAVLLRCAGVPSRYAVGYYATSQDPTDPGMLIAREQDAHAWAEAWDGSAWQTVDATPDDGRPDVIYRKTFAHRAWERAVGAAASMYAAWLSGELWFIPIALLLAGVLFFIVRRRRARSEDARKLAASRRRDDRFIDPRFAAFVVAFDEFLKRQNLRCPPWQTWTEFLNSAEIRSPQGVRELVREYSSARFGGGVPPDPAKLESSMLPETAPPDTNGSSS